MDIIEYFGTEEGRKLLKILGGGLVVLGTGIFTLMKFFKSDVSAKNDSIASGRDTNITVNHDEKDQS